MLGLYGDNGKENGNYYIIVGFRGLNNYPYYGSICLERQLDKPQRVEVPDWRFPFTVSGRRPISDDIPSKHLWGRFEICLFPNLSTKH